jgi:hypothetical protein
MTTTMILVQGIYNYIPETNHVSKVWSVAAILWLQFMVHVMQFPMTNVLYLYISTSRVMWVPVTTAWRVLRLRMEERPPVMEGSCEYIE